MDESQPFDHFGDPKGHKSVVLSNQSGAFVRQFTHDRARYPGGGWLPVRECHTINYRCS
jgi:hypothetical protein